MLSFRHYPVKLNEARVSRDTCVEEDREWGGHPGGCLCKASVGRTRPKIRILISFLAQSRPEIQDTLWPISNHFPKASCFGDEDGVFFFLRCAIRSSEGTSISLEVLDG